MEYRVSGASSIWMSFIKYTILTAAQKLLITFIDSNYPHQSLLCEAQTPPFLMLHVQIDGPSTTHRWPTEAHSWSGKLAPRCVTYPAYRMRAWPSSVLFRSWRLLESKFTTQDQRCSGPQPPAISQLVRRYEATSISACYCFVTDGVFYNSPGGESSSAKRGSGVIWCDCERRNREVAGVTNTRVSHSLSHLLRKWFNEF